MAAANAKANADQNSSNELTRLLRFSRIRPTFANSAPATIGVTASATSCICLDRMKCRGRTNRETPPATAPADAKNSKRAMARLVPDDSPTAWIATSRSVSPDQFDK